MKEQFIRTQYPTIFRDIDNNDLWYCIQPDKDCEFTIEYINNAIQNIKAKNI